MNKGAHLARLFLGNKLERIEVLNFARKFDRELFRVELLNVVGAIPTTHESGPCFFDSLANRRNETDARNYYPTCQFYAP